MAEFYFENLAKNLPDVYKKGTNSNNYKILEIERTANIELREMLSKIESILDINNASGSTLDMYGKRFGQVRGSANDAQYKAMIKSKIIRGLSNGSYKSVVDAICYTFNCSSDDILLEEGDTPMSISVTKLPITQINEAGFTIQQAQKIIQNLIPVCVKLDSMMFDGTFEFSDKENEYDETAGFSESENGTIGGFLGWTDTDEQGSDLPI